MIHLLNIEEWAERYKNNELSVAELKDLHEILDEDQVLNKAFQDSLQLQFLLNEKKANSQLKTSLKAAAAKHKTEQVPQLMTARKVSMMQIARKYWKPFSAAAGIALLSSLLTYNFSTDSKIKKTQYTLLKRDIESIKRSQNQIINNLNQQPAPVAFPGNFGGSGFAISNDGYFATNYHVVEGGDSVYIQTNDGIYYKATIITADPQSDLAILKVDKEDFKLNTAVPYNISKNQSLLGQKVYTIGYPKDEVVYNEGYISSEKGFNGDTTAYQLEITSNPGQSGAPVLDNNGNIIGIITGKQSNTSGTTFAVHSNQLLKVIDNLSEEHKLNLSGKGKMGNSRPEQVKTLREFVCAVRVYK